MSSADDLFNEHDRLMAEAAAQTSRDRAIDNTEARAILASLREKPRSADAIAQSLNYDIKTTRDVIRDLVVAGKVEDSNDREWTPSYAHTIVWRVVL